MGADELAHLARQARKLAEIAKARPSNLDAPVLYEMIAHLAEAIALLREEVGMA